MKRKWLIILVIISIISFISFLVFIKNDTDRSPADQSPPSSERDERASGKNIFALLQEAAIEVSTYKMNIVAIGDSLTYGVGDVSGTGGYVGLLEQSINKERETAIFKNFGVPGNRTDQLLKRLDQTEIQAAIDEADLILITIGANDIMQIAKENITNLQLDEFIAERERYEERLRESIDKIKKINTDAEIYLLGIYNPFEKYFHEIVELNMITEAWNDTGSSIAQETEKVTFVPIIDLFADKEENLFAKDNFHPNYNGYLLISERVLEYISNKEG